MLTIRTPNLNDPSAAFRNFLLATAALFALTVAALAPSQANAHRLNIGDAEEVLDELIEMDAKDIEDLEADLVEARSEIKNAIHEIEDAKDDVKDTPVGAAIAKIAFKVASTAVDRATGKAINEARKTLDEVEAQLHDQRDEIGETEFQETLGAVRMIRDELTEIELALDDLTDALHKAQKA